MITLPESPATASPLQALCCHPATPGAAVRAIDAGAVLTEAGALILSYRVHGDPADLRLPAPVAPGAADGLWQHTCLEAFVAGAGGTAYREFNFSPSGQWASYAFTAYRERAANFRPAAVPEIAFTHGNDGLLLTATLARELLPGDATLTIGLSAVIEAADGSNSYWALTHCAAQPDFHLRQSFALTLHRNTP